MLIPCDEVNILNTFRVMIILRLLLLLTNLHLKLLSTQGTGADKLLSTQRVNWEDSQPDSLISNLTCSFGYSFFLKQVVTKPTRGNNILDLVFCHDDLVDSIEISKTSISDHCILHINSSIPVMIKHSSSILYPPTSLLASLNFNKCSWDLINASLHCTDWQILLTDLTTIDCSNTFIKTLSRICQSVVPLYKKQSCRISKYYRERKTLMKKEPNSRQGFYVSLAL